MSKIGTLGGGEVVSIVIDYLGVLGMGLFPLERLF